MGWDMWFAGFFAGASLCLVVYPIAYHRGWLAGFNRRKNNY